DARLRQAWRFDPSGQAIAVAEPVEDFSVRNLAFQIRYRYELAPLSHLYIVYGRGGFDRNAIADGVDNALVDSFDLRDDEQLLVRHRDRRWRGQCPGRQLRPPRRRTAAGEAQLPLRALGRGVARVDRRDAPGALGSSGAVHLRAPQGIAPRVAMDAAVGALAG